MKLITAIIREEKLDEVRQALIDAEIERITVSRVSGHGQQQEIEVQRGKKVIPNLIPKIQIEIACNDAFEDITINAILRTARTGKVMPRLSEIGRVKFAFFPGEPASHCGFRVALAKWRERPFGRAERVMTGVLAVRHRLADC